MHFVITGGAGFIGSHLVEELLLQEHEVTVIDSLITGTLENLPIHPHLRVLQKDVLDCQPEDFSTPIAGLVHLAATPSVTESWIEPLKNHHNNLSTTLHTIQLCRELGVSRLVIASSAAVYGNCVQLPICESHPTEPISPYGLQKLTSEKYLELFAKQFGMSTVTLRIFNVFGPRQLPNSPYSGVVSIFLSAIQQNRPIIVYGDGQQTRDFICVKDVAMAFTQALTIPISTGDSLTCNIATGRATSLLELIKTLHHFFPNCCSEICFASARTGDIPHSLADISNASSILGFKTKRSLEEGLRLLIDSLELPSQSRFASR